MSYGRLLELTRRFAAALQGLGSQKGDRVRVHLPKLPPFVHRLLCHIYGWRHRRALQPAVHTREMKHQLMTRAPR